MTRETHNVLHVIGGIAFGFLLAREQEIRYAIVAKWQELRAGRRFRKALKNPDIRKDFV